MLRISVNLLCCVKAPIQVFDWGQSAQPRRQRQCKRFSFQFQLQALHQVQFCLSGASLASNLHNQATLHVVVVSRLHIFGIGAAQLKRLPFAWLTLLRHVSIRQRGKHTGDTSPSKAKSGV